MKLPNINSSKSVVAYFQKFHELNHGDPEFTYRRFADKIQWPHSYLNDLIKGRKPLTLKRALEFSVFSKLSTPETERLITLGLLDSCAEEHKPILAEQLEASQDLSLKTDLQQIDSEMNDVSLLVPADKMKDPALLALLTVIHWSEGRMSPQEMSEFLFSFPELSDPVTMDTKLALLEDLECIERTSERIVVLKLFPYFISATPADLAEYVQNLRDIVESPKQRGTAHTGFAMVSKDKILEMNQRLAALANWFLSVDKNYPHEGRDLQEYFPIKYDLFVNYAVDLEKLGYSIESDVIIPEQVPRPILSGLQTAL